MMLLEALDTEFGHIKIVKNPSDGRITYYQNMCFHSQATAEGVSTCAYVHVMFEVLRHASPRRVLALGCAGGTLATMLSRLGCEVTMVDINPHAFVFAKRYFQLPDSVECVAEDGRQFIARTQQVYDAIAIDVFDEQGVIPHAEGTYRPHDTSPPDTAFFLCQTAPVLPGGETTILDGAAYYQGLPTALRERMAPGMIYEMAWPAERWQNEFGVADEGALNTLLNSRGDVHYSIEAGELHLRYTVAPFTRCRAGILVFATGMLAHLPAITHPAYRDRNTFSKPTNRLYYADGSPFDEASIHQLLDVHDRLVYAHRWADDELLLLDNSRFMHGRTLVEGDCPRAIISRFGWLR